MVHYLCLWLSITLSFQHNYTNLLYQLHTLLLLSPFKILKGWDNKIYIFYLNIACIRVLTKNETVSTFIKTYFKNTSNINVHEGNFYFKQPYNPIKLPYFLNKITIESHIAEQWPNLLVVLCYFTFTLILLSSHMIFFNCSKSMTFNSIILA